jgi:hypothetical protein
MAKTATSNGPKLPDTSGKVGYPPRGGFQGTEGATEGEAEVMADHTSHGNLALAKGGNVAAMHVDEELSEGFVPLNTRPYNDYWHVEEDAVIRGELIARIQRFENDPDGEEDEMVMRQSFVVLTTRPCKCAKVIKDDDRDYEVRGEIVKSPTGADKDVYEVPAGTLVAFDVRKVLIPLIPLAHGKAATEIEVKVTGRQKSKQNAKRSYWTFKFGAKRLRKERDTSLDYLNAQAKFMKDSTALIESEIPF